MDENRRRKAYAGVYYAVKGVCVLLAGLFLVVSAQLLPLGAAWGVYVLLFAVLTVVANRSQGTAPQATPAE